MRRSRYIIVTMVLISAAACTAEPTAAPVAVPERPLLDGGYGLGSGNKSDSTLTQPSAVSTTSGAALPGGGYGLGSGN